MIPELWMSERVLISGGERVDVCGGELHEDEAFN